MSWRRWLRLIARGFGGSTGCSLCRSTLGFFLGAASSFFRLTLRHLLSGALSGFLLCAHLLFFSAACLFLGLALGHFLRTAFGLLLGTHLLLLLGAASSFFCLTLRHFLSGALCGFLLGTHLLFLGSTSGIFLLTLHSGGLRLLAGTFGVCGGLLSSDFLLHGNGLSFLPRFFTLGGGLLGLHALLCCLQRLLLSFSGRGCLLCGHPLSSSLQRD